MATLKTQGFQLSAMPTAPKIPRQIGLVDVKAIDEGVRRGLATFETLRSAGRGMALADEAADTEIAKAQTARNILPLTERRALAETTAIEEQLPHKTAILAAEADPRFIEARRKKMLMQSIPADMRSFLGLTEGMSEDDVDRALRIKLGMAPRASSAAIQYKEVIGPDGVTRLIAVDPRSVGAHVVGSGEGYGSNVGMPVAPVAPVSQAGTLPAATPDVDEFGNPIAAEIVATAIPPVAVPTAIAGNQAAPNVFRSPTIGDRKAQEVTAGKSAEVVIEAKAKLPKARAALESMEAATSRVDKEIDEAIGLVSNKTAGVGAVLSVLPQSDARKLASLVKSIGANIGFDALSTMRQNSPTGGALGNVSDFETKTLQATIADLDRYNDPKFVKAQLEKVRAARRDAVSRLRSQYDREVQFFGLTDADFSQNARDAAAPLTSPSSSGGEFKIIEIR